MGEGEGKEQKKQRRNSSTSSLPLLGEANVARGGIFLRFLFLFFSFIFFLFLPPGKRKHGEDIRVRSRHGFIHHNPRVLTRLVVRPRLFRLFLHFHPLRVSSPRRRDLPMIPEGTPSARRARRGRRRAKSRYMMRAAVTCKSGQSPTPLRFQIFKVCLDSSRRPRPRRWRRRRRRILPSLSLSLPLSLLEQKNSKKQRRSRREISLGRRTR